MHITTAVGVALAAGILSTGANLCAAQETHHHGAPNSAPDSTTTALGRDLFLQNCARCHGEDAGGKIGPALKGTPHSLDEIQHFVMHGIGSKMPAFSGKLTEQQIAAVASYVKSLGPPNPETAHGHGMAHQHGEMGHGEMAGMMDMSPIAGGGMTRQGSGTSWEPESTLMWAKMAHWGKWMIMQHGNAVVMYDAQTGPRGVSRPVSTNWYMLMGTRPVGKGQLMLRTMLSLEPATIGKNGQPQLFQTGEGLIDRQHPHDLFMEIASQYSHPVGRNLAGYLYLAPVGEPALGPVAFMHRASAMEIPTAPLTHHWLDSSHISFGVVTAGLQSNQWKGELSWFNGHEPDSQRWDIDPIRLNSVSGRLSYAPGPNWVFQVSRGHLDKPEIYYTPAQGDVDRTTFSAEYFRPLKRGFWATTFAWGRNEGSTQGGASGKPSDGFLVESNYNWADRNYLFGRIERVDKDELFPESDPRSHRQFLVNAFSLGYARDIGHTKSFETALGAMVTLYAKDSGLDKAYGDFPVGVQVFFRIRPRRMQMGGMGAGMEQMDGQPMPHQRMDGPEQKGPAGPDHHHGHTHGEVDPVEKAPRLAALLALKLAETDRRLTPVAP